MFENMDTNFQAGFIATQDTVERKNTARRGSSWIPVFTKDIRDVLPGQDSVRRGAFESSEVTFVGVIRSVERKLNSAGIDYYVDDNTGPPLLVYQLLEEERDGAMIPLAENTYVRVVGKVRTWGNTRSVMAFTIIPLKSMNEMTVHRLEVAHCKLFFAKDMLNRQGSLAQNKAISGGGGLATNGVPTSAYSHAPKAVAAPVTISAGLSGLNGEIHKFLSTATHESGYSVQDIQRRFPQLVSGRIREQLDLLASEGHVYTTVDDDHFRTTDSS